MCSIWKLLSTTLERKLATVVAFVPTKATLTFKLLPAIRTNACCVELMVVHGCALSENIQSYDIY